MKWIRCVSIRFVSLLIFFSLALLGCSSNPPISSSPKVLVDNIHGSAWPSIFTDLQKAGFQTQILDTPLKNATLDETNVLVISDANFPFRNNEVTQIKDFVNNGGLLVCADQAWSWVSPRYGNHPIASFPLNKIAQPLGFWFTGKAVGSPLHRQGVFNVAGLLKTKGWTPSKIQLLDLTQQTSDAIRDSKHNIIATRLSYGKGQILVFGHAGFLEHNPQLFVYAIKQALTHIQANH
jgi:hypothetical protein